MSFATWLYVSNNAQNFKMQFYKQSVFTVISLSCSVAWTFAYLLLFWEVLVVQSCLILCNSMDYSTPGSSVHGIFQARILECIAISFSRGSSQPRDQTHVSCTGGQILYHWAMREAQLVTGLPFINCFQITYRLLCKHFKGRKYLSSLQTLQLIHPLHPSYFFNFLHFPLQPDLSVLWGSYTC